MKKFKFTINGNQYEVCINNMEENNVDVEVNGVHYRVEMESSFISTKTPILIKKQADLSTDTYTSIEITNKPDAPKGGGTIKSPLPGVILDVFVKEGETVTMGQKLITLEAMKMENNINADKEGVIRSIKICKGDSVMEGDLLIVIEG
jgi:glutaconyl-CoA/methylmalonyl-CoA decarboxylase subunit gamma